MRLRRDSRTWLNLLIFMKTFYIAGHQDEERPGAGQVVGEDVTRSYLLTIFQTGKRYDL